MAVCVSARVHRRLQQLIASVHNRSYNYNYNYFTNQLQRQQEQQQQQQQTLQTSPKLRISH